MLKCVVRDRGRSHMMQSFTATHTEIPEVDEVHHSFISFAVRRNTQRETIAGDDKGKICRFSCMIIIPGSEAKLADPSTNRRTLHFPSSVFFT